MPTPLPAAIAWRYLTGIRSGNAVPILSKISMVAIGIGAAALIIVFSVSNGFGDLIKNLYGVFYPELRITPVEGKFTSLSKEKWDALQKVEGIAYLSPIIEDNVLVEGNEEQLVALVKGVHPTYFQIHPLDSFMSDGVHTLSYGETPTAIVGAHIAGDLGTDVNNVFSRLHLFYPNSNSTSSYTAPEQAFNRLDLKPDGVFRVQEDFDGRIILAPYAHVAALLGQEGQWSSIEITPAEGAATQKVQRALQAILGDQFKVETRYEQNRSLYNIMNSEKLVMYLILLLVLLIASFNMVGAMLLLVVEKQKDLSIMRAMGMSARSVGHIFRWEGMLWALVGGVLGLVLGILICLGQQHFSLVKMGDAFVIDAYPVALRASDVLVVLITVMMVGLLAALYPAQKAQKLVQH